MVKKMSTAAEIEIIVQNFHRSAYRHFERSTECLSQRSLNLGCSALPCTQSVRIAVKSKIRSQKFLKNRTVHKTLGEVARKLSAFMDISKKSKQRKICVKIDIPKARGGSNATISHHKVLSSIPDIDGSPSAYSDVDGHDYFGDTSRIHSIVLMQGKLMERTQVDLSENEIALN